MSLLDVQVADQYRALGAASADGAMMNAHWMRSAARSANWLILKGHPVLSYTLDSLDPGGSETPRALYAPGFLSWQPLLLGRVWRPKKALLNRAKVYLRAEITADETIYLQVGTLRNPATSRRALNAQHVWPMQGTGSLATYTLNDLRLDQRGSEVFEFFIRGRPTGVEGDDSTYTTSGSNRFLVQNWTQDGLITADNIVAPLPNWRTTSPTWAFGHYVVIHDGATKTGTIGNTLYEGMIYKVFSGSSLYAWPIPNPIQRAALEGKFGAIMRMTTARIVHLSIWAQDRDPDTLGV